MTAARGAGRIRGVDPHELPMAEAAFYDAIVQNDAAVMPVGDNVLKKVAVAPVAGVQSSATVDWSLKQSGRAAMRSKVRRLLARHDYLPDHETKAVELVLQQVELLVAK